MFGLRGDFAITDRIMLRGAAQIFGFEAEDAEGSFRDFYIGADYRFTDLFTVGLAYNDVQMDLRATEDRGFDAHLNWGYDGFLLYAKFDFGR